MNLKKYYPFIIPAISLFLVLFLAFRWYNLRIQRDNDLDTDGVDIEDLTEEDEIVIGTPDATTVTLEPEEEEPASGQVRYRLTDDRLLFSVAADLPKEEAALYQTWVSTDEQEAFQKAFTLEYSKGGYTGSASVSQDQLPLEIVVSRQSDPEVEEIERELLRGVIENDDLEKELEAEEDLE